MTTQPEQVTTSIDSVLAAGAKLYGYVAADLSHHTSRRREAWWIDMDKALKSWRDALAHHAVGYTRADPPQHAGRWAESPKVTCERSASELRPADSSVGDALPGAAPAKRITAGVRDMLAILEDANATEAEKDAAASTIVEAVEPDIMERAYPVRSGTVGLREMELTPEAVAQIQQVALSPSKCTVTPKEMPGAAPAAKDRLSKDDPEGWYECNYQGGVHRYVLWWTGVRLQATPQPEYLHSGGQHYRDFVRLVAQPPKSEPEPVAAVEWDLPDERSDFETFKEFTDDDSPIRPNMQKYYRRAARQIGSLFCWCIENMQPFPPTKGDWLDVVKQRLQVSFADRQELERLRKQVDDSQYCYANTLANINDTCRSRGFTAGPSGKGTEDRVIALAQAYDAVQQQVAELTEQLAAAEKAIGEAELEAARNSPGYVESVRDRARALRSALDEEKQAREAAEARVKALEAELAKLRAERVIRGGKGVALPDGWWAESWDSGPWTQIIHSQPGMLDFALTGRSYYRLPDTLPSDLREVIVGHCIDDGRTVTLARPLILPSDPGPQQGQRGAG